MWPTAAEARGPAVVWIHFLQELSPPLPLSTVCGMTNEIVFTPGIYWVEASCR